MKARTKEIVSKRKSKGLCADCGKYPARNASCRCEICTLKMTAADHLGSRKLYKPLMMLFLRQQGKCVYTGMQLTLGTNTSLDHRIPRTKGGTNDIDNLQWVHKSINTMKSDLSEEEFLDFCRRVATHTA
jgi:CRISPR/Cas system Type II protein with McrA/HNH and RuvC-like nuclease domain